MAVAFGTTNDYILGAAAGQMMAVQLDSVVGDAVFTVCASNGSTRAAEQYRATFHPPDEGTISSRSVQARGKATYQTTFWVDEFRLASTNPPVEGQSRLRKSVIAALTPRRVSV
jgi:hypothetical protein